MWSARIASRRFELESSNGDGSFELGTIGAWIAGRTLSGFLFGVTAAEPVTYAAMIVVLSVVALMSGDLPARRASRIDPIVALREA